MFSNVSSPQSKSTLPKESLLSVAGLIGSPVLHKDGQEVGTLVDLVCHWDREQRYPPLSGILVKVGRRIVWTPAQEIGSIEARKVHLKTARLDLRDFQPRSGEARLVQEVLDHQLVDVEGARVVRAADLYLTSTQNKTRLVGVDISYASLLRRLGPVRWRTKPSLRAVLDWGSIKSFGQVDGQYNLRLSASGKHLRRLRAAELADLLEDLGRAERQELLNSLTIEQAADALEEMHPEELESLLRESTPDAAASYLAEMEPDEAADALRYVDGQLREQLVARMPARNAKLVTSVLSHNEMTAGGIMNTAIITAKDTELVKELTKRLKNRDDDITMATAVVVTDEKGKLLYDLDFVNLFVADPDKPLHELISNQVPRTVEPENNIQQVADTLIVNRSTSVLVVDEKNRPIGRILADDIIDALLPETGRFHFPRIFS
ncbi:MAG: magnesium transporter MgtE N-terminal domain-containing protein [Candidatus Saccharimonadales bacterium]